MPIAPPMPQQQQVPGQNAHPTPDAPKEQLSGDPNLAPVADIDEDVKAGLLELVKTAQREYEGPWKSHFREWIEAEEFWKGNHYPVWMDKEFNWRTPFEFALENNRLEDMPMYQYAVNIFQSMGLSAISKLAERVPRVRWFPESASSEVDIATAKAASKASAYIEDKNRIKLIAIREGYLCWTQGVFGTWTRYIRDFKYGKINEPIIESSTVEIAPDRHICPTCGEETPTAEQDPSAQGASCASCGEALGDDSFVGAEQAEVPVVNGYKATPRGMVKMSVYGGINLCMMPYVADMSESGYLICPEEKSYAEIRSTWKETGKNIGVDMGNEGGNTTDTDAYAKNARMKLYDATQPFGAQRSYAGAAKNFATVKRCWFRPWYFYAINSEPIRNKVIAAFPNGCFVAFADGKFLEAEDRNVDDEWTVCTPMPGQGIYRPSLGSSTIPINKQIDDSSNIIAEHMDHASAPSMFFDAQHINPVALQNSPMRPGMYVPVVRQNGGTTKSLADMFHQPKFQLDAQIFNHPSKLMEIGQVVSGIIPSLFGGPLKGNDTLGAYQQSANQAMGKLLLFWQAVKQHHADVMTQAIRCFQQNETDDVEMTVIGVSGDATSEYIRLEEMQGSVIAKPESDEDFPTTLAEIRANLTSLAQSSPEFATFIQQLLANPANLPFVKRMVGADDLELPAETQREKMYREIDLLLQSPPLEMPQMQPGVADPATGAPGMPQMVMSYQPTIPPNVYIDDHLTNISTIQEWGRDKGTEQEKSNPAGYANVMARLLAEFDAQALYMRKMNETQIASMPPEMAQAQAEQAGGGGAPGGKQSGPPSQ